MADRRPAPRGANGCPSPNPFRLLLAAGRGGAAAPSGPPQEAARLAEWRAAFADEDPSAVEEAAALFPATTPATFARWLSIRSSIDAGAEAEEPLLRPEPDRLTILPLRDEGLWAFRKTLERLHWLPQEVDLTLDSRDRLKVTPGEYGLLRKVLGWFGPADEAVLAGLGEVAAAKVRRKEGQFYLRAQEDQECAHSEAYSLQIQEVLPVEDRDAVFRAARADPLVARVGDWVRWWVIAEHPVADFFAAMAFVEGVLCSGMFAALQHFKAKGVFPGVTALNEFIARDEGVHTLFWCFILTDRLLHRPEPAVVAAIARETLALSADFFLDALPAPIAGLNAELLTQYVRYVADCVSFQAGYPAVFHAANPFSFMDALGLNEVAKSNFFEFRPTQYQNIGTHGALEFAIDETDVADVEEDDESPR